MLYENSKELVRSPDGYIDFFDTVMGLLHHIFFYNLARIGTSNVDRSCKRKWFYSKKKKSKKARSRRYLAKAITDKDYADCLSLLASTHFPKQNSYDIAKSKQQEAYGLYGKANKTVNVF